MVASGRSGLDGYQNRPDLGTSRQGCEPSLGGEANQVRNRFTPVRVLGHGLPTWTTHIPPLKGTGETTAHTIATVGGWPNRRANWGATLLPAWYSPALRPYPKRTSGIPLPGIWLGSWTSLKRSSISLTGRKRIRMPATAYRAIKIAIDI